MTSPNLHPCHTYTHTKLPFTLIHLPSIIASVEQFSPFSFWHIPPERNSPIIVLPCSTYRGQDTVRFSWFHVFVSSFFFYIMYMNSVLRDNNKSNMEYAWQRQNMVPCLLFRHPVCVCAAEKHVSDMFHVSYDSQGQWGQMIYVHSSKAMRTSISTYLVFCWVSCPQLIWSRL